MTNEYNDYLNYDDYEPEEIDQIISSAVPDDAGPHTVAASLARIYLAHCAENGFRPEIILKEIGEAYADVLKDIREGRHRE